MMPEKSGLGRQNRLVWSFQDEEPRERPYSIAVAKKEIDRFDLARPSRNSEWTASLTPLRRPRYEIPGTQQPCVGDVLAIEYLALQRARRAAAACDRRGRLASARTASVGVIGSKSSDVEVERVIAPPLPPA
jgi:hypothetical protein